MKKLIVTAFALCMIVVVAAVTVRFMYPDTEVAAFVDKCWGRARSEFSDAWERVNAQDNYSAAIAKSVEDIAESSGSEAEGEGGETPAPAAAQAQTESRSAATGPALFTEENHYAGPSVQSEESLRGKVVMFYVWSIADKESAKRLPRVQSIWNALKHKPLVVVTSHRGGRHPKVPLVIKAARLTMPCYEGAGLSVEPPGAKKGPCFYVVDPDGKPVYCGKSDKYAMEAVINAFERVR